MWVQDGNNVTLCQVNPVGRKVIVKTCGGKEMGQTNPTMNHKFLLAFSLAVASSVAFFCTFPTGMAEPSPAALPALATTVQHGSSADAALLATEAARDRWAEHVRVQRVQSARHGMKWGLAGFHLIRPDDDPLWAPEYSQLGCSGNIYCWDVPQVRYQNLVYNSFKVPAGLLAPPPGTVPALCQISLDRIVSKTMSVLSIENEPNSLRTIVGTIDARTQAALQSLLQPQADDPIHGLTDWFGTSRSPTDTHTAMRVVLVSNDIVYVPFSVQDLLTAGGDPAVVTLATGLTQQEANAIVEQYDK